MKEVDCLKEVDVIKEVVEIKEVDEVIMIVAYYDITNRIFTFCGFSVCNHHALVRLKTRLEICRDRRDRRSCKIFPSCVKFWGNNANLLGNYQVTYALNE